LNPGPHPSKFVIQCEGCIIPLDHTPNWLLIWKLIETHISGTLLKAPLGILEYPIYYRIPSQNSPFLAAGMSTFSVIFSAPI
jgi:hypothetical protein